MHEGIFEKPIFGAHVDEWDLTPDYERFEELVLQDLREEFTPSGFCCLTRRLFEFPDGTEICPDVVVVVTGTGAALVECVADAKLRKELRKSHVEKVSKYRELLNAGAARLYVPPYCRVAESVERAAAQTGVELRRDLELPRDLELE